MRILGLGQGWRGRLHILVSLEIVKRIKEVTAITPWQSLLTKASARTSSLLVFRIKLGNRSSHAFGPVLTRSHLSMTPQRSSHPLLKGACLNRNKSSLYSEDSAAHSDTSKLCFNRNVCHKPMIKISTLRNDTIRWVSGVWVEALMNSYQLWDKLALNLFELQCSQR